MATNPDGRRKGLRPGGGGGNIGGRGKNEAYVNNQLERGGTLRGSKFKNNNNIDIW